MADRRLPGDGCADAAADYAQQIPVRVIAHILGVPDEMADTFTGWVRDSLEFADDPERTAAGQLRHRQVLPGADRAARSVSRGDDLLSELLHTEVDGGPIEQTLCSEWPRWC